MTTRPNIALLGREPGTQVYRDISNNPEDEQPPGLAVVRLDGDLFFATADALEDRIRDVIHSRSGLDGIVLDCEGINFVDSQGSAKMAEIARLAADSGLTLRLARVKPAVAATLERDGVLERIGSDPSTATSTEPCRLRPLTRPARRRPELRVARVAWCST